MGITVRGYELEAGEFTDEMVRVLTDYTNSQIPFVNRSRDCAQVLRLVFPEMPTAWTRNDTVWLNITEVALIIKYLAEELALSPEYREMLESMRDLPEVGDKFNEAIEQLDAAIEEEYSDDEGNYDDELEDEYEDDLDTKEEEIEPEPVARAIGPSRGFRPKARARR